MAEMLPPSPGSEDLQEWQDPLVAKFGDNILVQAAREPERVRQLLTEGHAVTANAMFAAIECKALNTLRLFLSSGASPNLRSDAAGSTYVGVREGWASADFTPTFCTEKNEWYPLQHAAHVWTLHDEDRDRRVAMIGLLLNRGADIYALYRQPLRRPEPFPFPGEEETDQQELAPEEPESEDVHGVGADHEASSPSTVPRTYGVRSVIHSIFEDGGCVQPILDHAGTRLDLEHRDPQGCTLLLSVCRSALGADAASDGVLEDVRWSTETGAYKRDPFPTSEATPSLFHALRMRGADLNAVDRNRKHVLHHLLEAQDPVSKSWRPPMIRNSLQYGLTKLPHLINQPDRHGTYPLHSALQRWRRYPINNAFTKAAGLETVIDDLLAADADPLVRDGRGNTALHYLADDRLAVQLQGEQHRRLFRVFLGRGVDINARNRSGRSALEMLLDDNGERAESLIRQNLLLSRNMPPLEDIEAEVFGMFDEAGVRWTEQDSKGRTLLHIVAKHPTPNAALRTKSLLAKGVDPKIADNDGKTALNVATESANQPVLDLLDGKDM